MSEVSGDGEGAEMSANSSGEDIARNGTDVDENEVDGDLHGSSS